MKLFGQRYLGLRGTKLNIAIGVIAGIDFLWVTILSNMLVYTTNDPKIVWL